MPHFGVCDTHIDRESMLGGGGGGGTTVPHLGQCPRGSARVREGVTGGGGARGLPPGVHIDVFIFLGKSCGACFRCTLPGVPISGVASMGSTGWLATAKALKLVLQNT